MSQNDVNTFSADDIPLKREDSPNTSSLPEVKTKRLFVTGKALVPLFLISYRLPFSVSERHFSFTLNYLSTHILNAIRPLKRKR